MQELAAYRAAVAGKSATEILSWAASTFGAQRVALASSLGAEDQVLTQMLAQQAPRPRLFTLDTGRLFQQSYDLMQRTMARYGVRYEVYAPEAAELAELIGRHGPNLFLESVELRRACCEVRKVRPLARVLPTLDAWICGLRRDQGVTRDDVTAIDWDATNGLYRISPLFDWDDAALWSFIREHKVPYNPLHDQGYPSIGCAPCTRAVAPGEDPRAGRWWWERAEQRECGLHRPGH